MKNNKSKLKRIISGFSVGVAATGAVVPVIACGDDGDSSTVSVAANVQNDLLKVTANLQGFSDLPEIPEHTHWEFKVNDGQFTRDLPTEFKAGDVEAIKLVADEGYELAGEAAREGIPVMAEVDTTGLQDALDTLKINTLDAKIELTPAPKGSHWEYQTNGGAFGTKAPDLATLTPDDTVGIQLVIEDNYTATTDDVVRTGIPVVAELDTTGLQADLDMVEDITVNTTEITLPDAPGYDAKNPDQSKSWWEYIVVEEGTDPDADTWTATPSKVDLSEYTFTRGETVKVQLVAQKDYSFSTATPEREFTVVAKAATDGFQEKLDKLVIQPKAVMTEAELPDLPETIDPDVSPDVVKWEYQVRGAGDWLSVSKNDNDKYIIDLGQYDLVNGDQFAIRLNLGDDNVSTDGKIEKTYTVVTQVNTENDVAELPKLPNPLTTQTDFKLPDLVDKTHTRWQYSIDSGKTFTDLVDKDNKNEAVTTIDITEKGWKLAQEVQIQLGFDKYYVGTKEVPKRSFVVSSKVDTTDLQKNLNGVGLPNVAQTDFTLPTLTDTTHTRWQYSTDEGATFVDLKDDKGKATYEIDITKTDLDVGKKLKVQLNLDKGYESSTGPVSRDFTVQKILNTTTVKADLEKLGNPKVNQTDFTLPHLSGGVHVRWKYSTNGGESFNRLVDKNGEATFVIDVTKMKWEIGKKVLIELDVDPNYVSSAGSISKEFTVVETVDVPKAFETEFAKVTATHENGIEGLPNITDPTNKDKDGKDISNPTYIKHAKYAFTIDGKVIDHQPTKDDLTAGKQLKISVVTDDGYELNKAVSPRTFEITELIDFGMDKNAWNLAISNAKYTYGDANFESKVNAPTGTKWQYSTDRGKTFTDNAPPANTAAAGDLFTIKLVPEKGWVIPDDFKDADLEHEYTVQQKEVDVSGLQAKLDGVEFTYGEKFEDVINGVAPAPTGAKWQYNGHDKIDPTSVPAGDKVEVTLLATDHNYQLTGNFTIEIEVQAKRIDIDRGALTDKLNAIKADKTNGVTNIPTDLPEHTVLMFNNGKGWTTEVPKKEDLPNPGQIQVKLGAATNYFFEQGDIQVNITVAA